MFETAPGRVLGAFWRIVTLLLSFNATTDSVISEVEATNIVQNSTQNLIKINQKSFKISSMGADWAVLVAGTRVYGVLEASWSRPGSIQSVLEVFTKHLGDVLGRLGGILRTSWGAVKASCGRFGGIWETTRGRPGAPWAIHRRPGSPSNHFRASVREKTTSRCI